MSTGFTACALLAALLISADASGQSFDQSEIRLVQTLAHEPAELARYQFLSREIPRLPSGDRPLAEQYLSFTEDELGLYSQAIFSFPLRNRLPANLALPTTAGWKSGNAVDVITALAGHRRIVMINEAHHDAHTRQLTLALLPRLRALGFAYFAAEALGGNDPELTKRGYPIRTSGTEYLREPVYGDIVREAIRLGFTIVPYDNTDSGEARENEQAMALYQKVFAKDPHAKLFVHAGYAHIDKAPGRLDTLAPMAMRLQELTGADPLCIDQTDLLESGLNTADAYHQLIHSFPSKTPEVLLDLHNGTPWSDRPALYDVSVILPSTLNVSAFGVDNSISETVKVRHVTGTPQVASGDVMVRPAWLSLGGTRHPFPITTDMCRKITPCVVDAHYFAEPDDATAADRYAFMDIGESTDLYLRPGRYRLRGRDSNGRTLSERMVEIAGP